MTPRLIPDYHRFSTLSGWVNDHENGGSILLNIDNEPERTSGRNARKSGTAGRKKPGPAPPKHTASERERMQAGLRILARMIARAHLRQQASGGESAPLDQGAGD